MTPLLKTGSHNCLSSNFQEKYREKKTNPTKQNKKIPKPPPPATITNKKQINKQTNKRQKKKTQTTKTNKKPEQHLKKLRCGDHIGETVMSLRLIMLFLKMSMTNSAHAFSHSLINSRQLFPGIMQENLG